MFSPLKRVMALPPPSDVIESGPQIHHVAHGEFRDTNRVFAERPRVLRISFSPVLAARFFEKSSAPGRLGPFIPRRPVA